MLFIEGYFYFCPLLFWPPLSPMRNVISDLTMVARFDGDFIVFNYVPQVFYRIFKEV